MGKSKGGRKKPPQAPTPKSIKSGFNLNKSPFRWSFEKCFWEHKGWQKLNVQNFAEKIISKLQTKYRTQARELMADQELRRKLDWTDPNPTWEGILRHKIKDKGMSYEQAIEDIYKTATKSNEKVNRNLGLE